MLPSLATTACRTSTHGWSWPTTRSGGRGICWRRRVEGARRWPATGGSMLTSPPPSTRLTLASSSRSSPMTMAASGRRPRSSPPWPERKRATSGNARFSGRARRWRPPGMRTPPSRCGRRCERRRRPTTTACGRPSSWVTAAARWRTPGWTSHSTRTGRPSRRGCGRPPMRTPPERWKSSCTTSTGGWGRSCWRWACAAAPASSSAWCWRPPQATPPLSTRRPDSSIP